MFNLNKKQMEMAMKKMGMKTEEIDAEKVIIEAKDRQIVIIDPQVTKIVMGGQETFQVAGQITEEKKEKVTKDDIIFVSEQAKVSEDAAREMLEQTDGNIAEAVMKLKK